MDSRSYFSRTDFLLDDTQEDVSNFQFRHPGLFKQMQSPPARSLRPGVKLEVSGGSSLGKSSEQASRGVNPGYVPPRLSDYPDTYPRGLSREDTNARLGSVINDGPQGRVPPKQTATRARTRPQQPKSVAKETIVIDDDDAEESDDEVQILKESPSNFPRKTERRSGAPRVSSSVKREIRMKQEDAGVETKHQPMLAPLREAPPRRQEVKRSPAAGHGTPNQQFVRELSNLLDLYSKTLESEREEAHAGQEKLKNELMSIQRERGQFKYELEKVQREKEEYRDEMKKTSSLIQSYRERISQLEKFLRGLASDRDALRNEGNDIRRLCAEIEEAKETYAGDIEAVKQSAEQWESFRARGWDVYSRSLTEARCHIGNLQQQIDLQQQQLEDGAGRLAEARDQNIDLEKRNKQNLDLYKDLVSLIEQGKSHILTKLGELRQETQDRGLDDCYGEKLDECLTLLHYLDESKEERQNAVQQINSSMSCLSRDVSKSLQSVVEQQAAAAQDKNDLVSLVRDEVQNLKNQQQTESSIIRENVGLRERKAIIEERLASKEREVAELRERLNSAESLFEKKTVILKHDIATLRTENEASGRVKTELEETREKHKVLQAELANVKEQLQLREQQDETRMEEINTLNRLCKLSQDELERAQSTISSLKFEHNGQETRFNAQKKTVVEEARVHAEKMSIEYKNKIHELNSIKNELQEKVKLLEEEIKAERSANTNKKEQVAHLKGKLASEELELASLKRTVDQLQQQLESLTKLDASQLSQRGKSPFQAHSAAMQKTPQRENSPLGLGIGAKKMSAQLSVDKTTDDNKGGKRQALWGKSLAETPPKHGSGFVKENLKTYSHNSAKPTPNKTTPNGKKPGGPRDNDKSLENDNTGNSNVQLGSKGEKSLQDHLEELYHEPINEQISPNRQIDTQITGLEPGSLLRGGTQRYQARNFADFEKGFDSTPLTSPPSSIASKDPSECADTPTPVTRTNRRKSRNMSKDDNGELGGNADEDDASKQSDNPRETYCQSALSALIDFKRDNPGAWSSSGKQPRATTPNPLPSSPISMNQRKPMKEGQNGSRKRAAENEPETVSTPKRNRANTHPRNNTPQSKNKNKDPRNQSSLSHWETNKVAADMAASNNRRQTYRGRYGKYSQANKRKQN